MPLNVELLGKAPVRSFYNRLFPNYLELHPLFQKDNAMNLVKSLSNIVSNLHNGERLRTTCRTWAAATVVIT